MSGLASSPDVRVGSSLSGQLPEIATGCCRPTTVVQCFKPNDRVVALAGAIDDVQSDDCCRTSAH